MELLLVLDFSSKKISDGVGRGGVAGTGGDGWRSGRGEENLSFSHHVRSTSDWYLTNKFRNLVKLYST